MQARFGSATVELVLGDITQVTTDAIVNAANRQLAGGGGVDGAIHRAAGPALMQETVERYPNGCPTGSAVITGGGRLVAKYVIHAVGPVWHGGSSHEGERLTSAYRATLQLAADHQCRSIALPAISTGAYGYPLAEASRVAIGAAAEFLKQPSSLELVRFVLFGDAAMKAFEAALTQARGSKR